MLAHQAQVRGLWAPGLLAPDPSRLWAGGSGPGFATKAGRGFWSLVKAGVILVIAGWTIRSGWFDFHRGSDAIAIGAEAAEKSLEQINEAIAALTPAADSNGGAGGK